ncbi:hypothetical protein, partial [Salmonella enterica]|uniref:hypothetical protein n=1 Tax=Salmonella enterica TaxID=28901 RepID=UPI003FD6E582
SSYGIRLEAADGHTVTGNWIGAASHGIQAMTGSDSNIIQGNRIGTDLAGTANWGSTFDGISIAGNNNRVGGSGVGQGNIVAYSNRGGGSSDGIA